MRTRRKCASVAVDLYVLVTDKKNKQTRVVVYQQKNSVWLNAWRVFLVVPAPDTPPCMESKSLTLATATKALSVRTPEEINLLPPVPGFSAGLNRGQRAGRSSRRLCNVSLMGCKDKQITGMRRGLVVVMSLWFTPGWFRLIRDN